MEKEAKKILIDGDSKFGKALFDNLIKAFNESKSEIVIEKPKQLRKTIKSDQTRI